MSYWTNETIDNYMFFSSYGFLDEIDERLESLGMQRKDLAKRVGVTEGRISQVFRNPGNLTLKLVAKLAQAVDLKISLVAYEASQLLHPQIFKRCWEAYGCPEGLPKANRGPFLDVRGRNENAVPASWGMVGEFDLAA